MMRIQGIITPAVAAFAQDVREGLSKPQKELLSKYLYDDVGSELFEVITLLPEYGLTRAGQRLLQRYAEQIVERVPGPVMVAELGSGSGKKTRWILEALSRRQFIRYYPIDISAQALARSRSELSEIPFMSLVGFERDYLDGLLEVAARRRNGDHLLVLFLGSTIGNFDRPAGEAFLREVRGHLIPGDSLLLATDLEQPVHELELAYNDPLGVTAAFNLNLLARINRELDADFDLAKFEHLAPYNTVERRIEMHLRARVAHTVVIPKADFEVRFREGETIWTESSHKFDLDEVRQMAGRCGFRCEAQWVDAEWPFSQNLWIAV
jgi:dimethylhistidine N-methyltransferase